MLNNQKDGTEGRFIVKVLSDIAKELKLEMKTFSDDWIISLNDGKKTGWIFGYIFSLNSATSSKIALDKVATYLTLNAEKIPAVEHVLIPSPKILSHYYNCKDGNWEKIMGYAKKNGGRVVCKPVNGTMGDDVYFTSNQTELELATHTLLTKNRDIALSPWLEIEDEFRVTVLDETVLLIMRKIRASIIGDGKSTLLQKIAEEIPDAGKVIKEIPDDDLQRVLDEEEEYVLSNKHNLTHGSIPEIIDESHIEYDKLVELALKAGKRIGIRFASVDIVKVDEKFMVLEINSGVTMKKFAGFSDENYKITKKIYTEAVKKMF